MESAAGRTGVVISAIRKLKRKAVGGMIDAELGDIEQVQTEGQADGLGLAAWQCPPIDPAIASWLAAIGHRLAALQQEAAR